MTYSQQNPPLVAAAVADMQSYVDWPAIIGGIVLASALSVVMIAFGSAIGLTFVSVSSSAKGVAIGAGIGAALWFIWVQVSSFMAGAYLTGRMRKRAHDSTEHEVEIRDGSHGLLVWGGSVVLGTVLAFSGASSLVNSAGSIAKTATEAASNAANGAAANPMQYYTDVLLRAPSGTAATPPRSDKAGIATEINTLLARSAVSALSADDKAYLAQVVSQQTGVPADVATTRVDQAMANIDKVKAETAKAADTTRRVGVLAAFLLAASMLVSAAAAYWAATLGGGHQDEAVVFTGFFKRV